MGILNQIQIQIGCIYTEANWIQIQTQTTSPIWICDPDSNPDLGPGAHVKSSLSILKNEVFSFSGVEQYM